MLPILHLGPLAMPTAGLVLILGLWLGLKASEYAARQAALNPDEVYNLILAGLATGIVGARLVYVLHYPGAFSANWISLFALNPGLLDLWGGMVIGGMAALGFVARRRLPFWEMADTLTPGLAVFAVALGIAHLASGDAYGATADLPWAIELWGARRHPTQLYEIVAAVLVLFFVWRGLKSRSTARPGSSFLVFSALSAGARLFLEAFRGDSVLLPGGLRAAQVAAWVLLAASLWGLARWQARTEP